MNNPNKTLARHAMARRLFGLWMLVVACTGIGSVHAQTVEYIHTDALGTPVAVTDANRNVIERSEYEPYGMMLNRPISDGPGYTGHVMDAATGLTYMQQRYYDPTIGRFLSVDPITANSSTGGNFNRYWYANNNPYKFTDSDGRFAVVVPIVIEACAASVVCGAAAIATGAYIGKKIGDGISYLRDLAQRNESADADPNGSTTKETKERGSKGGDGGTSEITVETDEAGRTVSTTHTVTTDGEVVHQHQDHVGEEGSKRRFADDLTGTKTVGEGKQTPTPDDQGPRLPREPAKGSSRY